MTCMSWIYPVVLLTYLEVYIYLLIDILLLNHAVSTGKRSQIYSTDAHDLFRKEQTDFLSCRRSSYILINRKYLHVVDARGPVTWFLVRLARSWKRHRKFSGFLTCILLADDRIICSKRIARPRDRHADTDLEAGRETHTETEADGERQRIPRVQCLCLIGRSVSDSRRRCVFSEILWSKLSTRWWVVSRLSVLTR